MQRTVQYYYACMIAHLLIAMVSPPFHDVKWLSVHRAKGSMKSDYVMSVTGHAECPR